MNLRAVARHTGVCVLGAGLAVLTAYSGLRLERRPPVPAGAAEPVYVPSARYLRPLSLGYQNVLADLLWFRTISYFGRHYRSDRTYPWLAAMCDLVTDLDPRAGYVYRFGGMILPWEVGRVDEGIRLLEKGVRALPDSWLLRYWLGFYYYQFRRDYERAATQLQEAVKLPDAHPHVAMLLASIQQEHYGLEATLTFLSDMRAKLRGSRMQRVVDEQIKRVRLARAVAVLEKAAKEYQSRFGFWPVEVSDLVTAGLLDAIPADPFGGLYTVDPETGEVRSSTGAKPALLGRHRGGKEEGGRGEGGSREIER